MQIGKFNIVMGAQAGSEAKGKMAGILAKKYEPDVIYMTSSPNAGHTLVRDGQTFITYHLPVSWVESPESVVILGPASIIKVEKLLKELSYLPVNRTKLIIDPRAAIVKDSYIRREKEEGLLKIGSTNQGVGIARSEKLMRSTDMVFAKDVRNLAGFVEQDTAPILNHYLDQGATILAESTQGFDLCLEHGIDPHYCTSKIIHPAMTLAEAGVSPYFMGSLYGVFRPYPIRVNNREGSSGPYADSPEITWGMVRERCGSDRDLQELTTTTRLLRRVFEFSHLRFGRFLKQCRPSHLCLQFANYINWADHKKTNWSELSEETRSWIGNIENRYGVYIQYIGTGREEMVDRNEQGTET